MAQYRLSRHFARLICHDNPFIARRAGRAGRVDNDKRARDVDPYVATIGSENPTALSATSSGASGQRPARVRRWKRAGPPVCRTTGNGNSTAGCRHIRQRHGLTGAVAAVRGKLLTARVHSATIGATNAGRLPAPFSGRLQPQPHLLLGAEPAPSPAFHRPTTRHHTARRHLCTSDR